MTYKTSFYKAPRYLFRKHNVLNFLRECSDIQTFIDVGCGAGELACTLAENGKKGVAVDFSENAIEIAEGIRKSRDIPAKNLSFKLGGLENVKNRKFDLVTCFEVLEHIENDTALLENLIKHSKKYVMLSVPAKPKLFDASDIAVGHFRRYEKKDLITMLNNAGLEIVQFANYGYPFTDIVRIGRKMVFKTKLRENASHSMAVRSKDSGINPIKLSSGFSKIDIENFIKPLYHVSRIFNNYDLSEGYLVLCKMKK